MRQGSAASHADLNSAKDHDQSPKTPFDCLSDPASVWVGSSLGRKPGEHLTLLLNDREGDYIVRGIYPDLNGAESAIVTAKLPSRESQRIGMTGLMQTVDTRAHTSMQAEAPQAAGSRLICLLAIRLSRMRPPHPRSYR